MNGHFESLTKWADRERTRASDAVDGEAVSGQTTDDFAPVRADRDLSCPTDGFADDAQAGFSGTEGLAWPSAREGLARCPFCRSVDLPRDEEGVRECVACGRHLLLVKGPAPSDSNVAVPALYGQYRALSFAGRGGMGVVLRGVDSATAEPVAIKLLIGGGRVGRKAIARFHREVAALRGLHHPNIVRLLSHGTIGNQRFLVMDWVEGPTFRDIIENCLRVGNGPRYKVARDWLVQACAGLAAIHAAGVLHRDIKPSNLLLENSAIVRIADFGIACLPPRCTAPPDAILMRPELPFIGSPLGEPLTVAGEFSGTAAYLAPECLRSAFAASPQSDLYALGVTFYEILTGQRPVAVRRAHLTANQAVAGGIERVIERLLATSPIDRFSSADEVSRALRSAEHSW